MSNKKAEKRARQQQKFADRKLRASDIAKLMRREAYAIRLEEFPYPGADAVQMMLCNLADRLEGKR